VMIHRLRLIIDEVMRLAIAAICYISRVSSEEPEHPEETLADVEEATELRMHSVADLQKGFPQFFGRPTPDDTRDTRTLRHRWAR